MKLSSNRENGRDALFTLKRTVCETGLVLDGDHVLVPGLAGLAVALLEDLDLDLLVQLVEGQREHEVGVRGDRVAGT